MAMIDVDDFKTINDRHGHAVGDRVLAAVAETLARSLRADDLVARLGGDEFAILAACLTLSQAEGRCASIGRAVQNACRPIVHGRRGTVHQHRRGGVLGRRYARKPAAASGRGALRGQTKRQGAGRDRRPARSFATCGKPR